MIGAESSHKLDALIELFDRANVLTDQQRERLWNKYWDDGWDRIVNERESYQDAFNVQDIYRQDESSFRSSLKETNQDLAWQCDKVSGDFHKYLETGEMPPPYFPMRIAIILRKAKEHEREKRFLQAWCRHFGGVSADAGVKYPKLAERARKLGIRPVENIQHCISSGKVLSVRNEHDRTLIVKFECGPYGSFKFLLPAGESFMYTVGERDVQFRFSDSALEVPKDAIVIPIRQRNQD